ncbi:MAG: hypothetical protein WBV39_07310 [Rudaea sp.]
MRQGRVFVELKPADDGKDAPRKTPRRQWFRRDAINLAEVAVETFAVVLGILLALAINEWQSRRETAERVATARTAIHAEVRSNRVAVAKTVAYDKQVVAALQAALDGSHPPANCTNIDQWHGLNTPVLLSSAYDGATRAGILADMNFDEASDIAGIYARQNRYEAISDKAADWLMLKLMGEPKLCSGLMRDLGNSGQNLVGDYDRFLQPATPKLQGPSD